MFWIEKMLKKAKGYPSLIHHLRADGHNLSSVFPWGVKTRPLGWIIPQNGNRCVNHKLEAKPERAGQSEVSPSAL